MLAFKVQAKLFGSLHTEDDTHSFEYHDQGCETEEVRGYYGMLFCYIITNIFLRLVKSKEMKSFKKFCHNYFIEVVSTLCFGGQSAPEPALIKMLMEVVFTKDKDMVSPMPGGKIDEVSVVRSSLLQLLLEHK